jgi:hypothetical protein
MMLGVVAFAYAYLEHRFWLLQSATSFLFVEFFVRLTLPCRFDKRGRDALSYVAWTTASGCPAAAIHVARRRARAVTVLRVAVADGCLPR